MPKFAAADIAVYALSYDEADALRDFRDAHGITYQLLSDPDSAVIRSFGILNTLINEDDHPWFGIPYPGTYVIDQGGDITHKFFDSNLAVRAGAEQLLRAARGETVLAEEAPALTDNEVSVDVRLDGEAVTSVVQKDLVATFNVPAGKHVYAAPAPQGSVAVDLVLDPNAALVQRPAQRPPSEQHLLTGTQETFQVHHNQFELRIPITVNSAIGNADRITLSGEVRWQSCDDEVCDIPASQRFEISVPVTPPPKSAIGGDGAEQEPNAMAHFQKMTARRQQQT